MSYAFDLSKILELVKELGIIGAVFLIFCVGIAAKLDKIVIAIGTIVKDWRQHNLKSKDLDHRIQRENLALNLELEKYKNKTVNRTLGKRS